MQTNVKQFAIRRFPPVLLAMCLTLVVTAQDVYKTPSGKKYHLETCKMVKNVSQKITLQGAAELGLEACRICKPAALPVPQNAPGKAHGEAKTEQCRGMTKKGSRCKHMTRIGDGYCFQHRPK